MLNEIRTKLIKESDYDLDEVLAMSKFELFDAWLENEGIMGFSYEIAEAIYAIYGIDLDSVDNEG